jgi:hypothetical protein
LGGPWQLALCLILHLLLPPPTCLPAASSSARRPRIFPLLSQAPDSGHRPHVVGVWRWWRAGVRGPAMAAIGGGFPCFVFAVETGERHCHVLLWLSMGNMLPCFVFTVETGEWFVTRIEFVDVRWYKKTCSSIPKLFSASRFFNCSAMWRSFFFWCRATNWWDNEISVIGLGLP